jgi:glucose/arabinose dehydrogenase
MKTLRSIGPAVLLAGGLSLGVVGAYSCGDSPPDAVPGTPPAANPAPPSSPSPGPTTPPSTSPPSPQPPVSPPATPPAAPPNTPPVAPPVAGEPPACTDADAKLGGLRLVTVATANRPIHLIGHPSDPETVLIAERAGTVRRAKGLRSAEMPVQLSEPILTVQTNAGSERGLLSLALHPTDPAKLYVFYNDAASSNDSVVQEFQLNVETGMATAGKVLYRAPHQAGNHQGGNLAFGADKMLYFSIGDNGSFGGRGAAIALNNNYGKILRVDPATGMPPEGNHMGLIWSYGLRNPWRMSFDRKTGDLYIGDVGQGTEEINFQPAGKAGTNYGWSGGGADLGAPVASYPTRQGQNCVIGGYVYRGTRNGCMYGRYFYKDRARAAAQSFVIQNGKAADERTHAGLSHNGNLYSFGEDGAGELYMLWGDPNGRVARIAE